MSRATLIRSLIITVLIGHSLAGQSQAQSMASITAVQTYVNTTAGETAFLPRDMLMTSHAASATNGRQDVPDIFWIDHEWIDANGKIVRLVSSTAKSAGPGATVGWLNFFSNYVVPPVASSQYICWIRVEGINAGRIARDHFSAMYNIGN